jgi:uncharacterized protein YjbI with pentapeptide repeats
VEDNKRLYSDIPCASEVAMPQFSRDEILSRIHSGESLRGLNLMRIDLSSAAMAQVDFSEANLRMANLSSANLIEARMNRAHLSGAILNRANLMGASLVEASMIGAVLHGADLSRADLSGADLTGANLEGAQLVGAYLVGAFLNETDLSHANLSSAYIRMAQMDGSKLANAMLEGADLSHANLSGVNLNGCCLAGANLANANLSASSLVGCDLRGADLTGANLSGCNLTGAKLHGIKSRGLNLADAWADWVDLSNDAAEMRVSLEEVFAEILGKPLAQILIEGQVSDKAWAEILLHLCEFQQSHPDQSDVHLKAIGQGATSSAILLEADHELSLVAYLSEFADIIGKGSLELFEKLAAVVGDEKHSLTLNLKKTKRHRKGNDIELDLASLLLANGFSCTGSTEADRVSGLASSTRIEVLQRSGFWNSEKAVAVLTGNRDIWFEAASSDSLTLRSPHGCFAGLDLVHGRFVKNFDRK